MNLEWDCLTAAQRAALTALGQGGLCRLPGDIGEQLYNLGLAGTPADGLYRITVTGSTVLPTTIH